jgi:hypothetical protein
VHALHTQVCELDYAIELEVVCPDNDTNDVAFIQATATIGGHDAVEEYVVCKMYLLAVSFGFASVTLGMTPVSKVETPLPLFCCGERCCRVRHSCLGGGRDEGQESVRELQAKRI